MKNNTGYTIAILFLGLFLLTVPLNIKESRASNTNLNADGINKKQEDGIDEDKNNSEDKKYENQDFVFDTKVPETKEELEKYQFHEFDYDSFRLACKIQRATEILLWDDEARLDLEPAAAARELENLGNAITDAGVMIKLLREYFNCINK